jgi:hypothetical protein
MLREQQWELRRSDNVVVDIALIEALDDVASRAAPAIEVRDIGGWLARQSPGLATKRAALCLREPTGRI